MDTADAVHDTPGALYLLGFPALKQDSHGGVNLCWTSRILKAALCFPPLHPVEGMRKNIACSNAQTIAHDLCGL